MTKFNQKDQLKTFIASNAELRKNPKSDFKKRFFQANKYNSVFCKAIDNAQQH